MKRIMTDHSLFGSPASPTQTEPDEPAWIGLLRKARKETSIVLHSHSRSNSTDEKKNHNVSSNLDRSLSCSLDSTVGDPAIHASSPEEDKKCKKCLSRAKLNCEDLANADICVPPSATVRTSGSHSNSEPNPASSDEPIINDQNSTSEDPQLRKIDGSNIDPAYPIPLAENSNTSSSSEIGTDSEKQVESEDAASPSHSDNLNKDRGDEEIDGDDIVRPLREEVTSHHVHSKVKYGDASSIIGGTSTLPSRPSSTHNSKAEKDEAADEPEISELSQQLSNHHMDEKQESTQKVFNFSLPFSNPLAAWSSGKTLPIISNIKLPKILREEIDATRPVLTKEQKVNLTNKLQRQESLQTLEEEYLYRNVHQQDNGHLRAIKKVLTPNRSLSFSSSPEVKYDPFNEVTGDVVILGGYRGSILRDRPTGKRVWIPLKAGLHLRKIDLTVGINDEDEYDMEKYIYPDGLLTHIGPVDVARRLIKRLKANPKCRVHIFAYDWRLSGDINSEKLKKLLEKLPGNSSTTDKKGALVIAHSMGGLIAHHAMMKNPKLFSALLYVGVPSACPNILGPFRYGDSVLLSSKVLTAQVNFLMRSSYLFLPMSGKCFIDKLTGERYDIDFFDVKNWIEYGFSPIASKTRMNEDDKKFLEAFLKEKDASIQKEESDNEISKPLDDLDSCVVKNDKYLPPTHFNFHKISNSKTEPINLRIPSSPTSFGYFPPEEIVPFQNAVVYLDRTLKRTKKFLTDLQFDPTQVDELPPLGIVYGNKIPTLKGSRVKGKQGIKNGDYDDFIYGVGDGVIYKGSLMPEGYGYPVCVKVPSDAGHVGLLSDLDAISNALDGILKEMKKR